VLTADRKKAVWASARILLEDCFQVFCWISATVHQFVCVSYPQLYIPYLVRPTCHQLIANAQSANAGTRSNTYSSCRLQIDAQHSNYRVCQTVRTPACATSGTVISVVNSSAWMHARLARIYAFSAVSLASMLAERQWESSTWTRKCAAASRVAICVATTRNIHAQQRQHAVFNCVRAGRWKCETWKCEKRDSMEHRVLHMSVHCRAGMH